MKKSISEKKMTLEQYQQKYTHPENIKVARSILFIISAALGVVVAATLFFVVLELFKIHKIAGYVGIVVAIIIFIFAYVIPIVKLKNTKSFITNVDANNARQAQKYNKQLREDIADKMIDLNTKTEGVSWYSDKRIGQIAIARHTKNDKELKTALIDIYKTDVKKASDKMITKSAFNTGVATAISQSGTIDTLVVVVYQLNLIKDIVYLYGYRPSETQMVKIYKNVFINSLIAYGASSATTGVTKIVGKGLVSMIDKASQSSSNVAAVVGSIAGGIAGTIVESGIQFVVNTTLTAIIGNQTRRYLVKEYNLQEMLDNIELVESEEEEAKMIEEITNEVKKNVFKKQKKHKADLVTS